MCVSVCVIERLTQFVCLYSVRTVRGEKNIDTLYVQRDLPSEADTTTNTTTTADKTIKTTCNRQNVLHIVNKVFALLFRFICALHPLRGEFIFVKFKFLCTYCISFVAFVWQSKSAWTIFFFTFLCVDFCSVYVFKISQSMSKNTVQRVALKQINCGLKVQ